MSQSRARPAIAFGSPKAVIERNQGEEQAFSAQVADRQRGVAMLEVLKHSDRSLAERAYCPPAPKPQPHPLKPIALIRTLKRNPLECWQRSTSNNRSLQADCPWGTRCWSTS